MAWATYHHASLASPTLACFLHQPIGVPAVSENFFLMVSLAYRPDPSVPVEKKFELRGAHLSDKHDPTLAPLARVINMGHKHAVELGKREKGRRYRGTGTYLLVVRFRPEDVDEYYTGGVDGVSFTKHFGIAVEWARAKPACWSPLDQLKENLDSGRKMRFCCGRIEGLPTCCCGGWTHERPSARGGSGPAESDRK
ncbi:hypothetical protein C8Q76DRAFT_743796 [Earliella scabrosa]|nr:hypothetical protein C8Q76DRAFT_743796 [Earliella scabrosa]